jgi:hypothetical protein
MFTFGDELMMGGKEREGYAFIKLKLNLLS